MIPGLNPWLIVGLLVGWIATAMGGFFYGEHVESLAAKAAIAKQSAEAATLLAKLNDQTAAKNQAAAEFARQLDEQHAQSTAEINAASADFRAQLDERVRQLAASRKSGAGCVPASAAPAGSSSAAAAGGDGGLSGLDTGKLTEAYTAAVKLQEDLKLCHQWAAQVGR